MGVPPTVSARDIIVGKGSGSSSTIQEAVDGAEAGDVIIIKPGTYVENINVSKAGLTIKPETNNVFIKPTDSTVATIILSNVGITLTGFDIDGSVYVNNALLGNSEYYLNNMSQITNNVIENGGIGTGSESSGIIISGNKITGGSGIDVSCCGDYNEITNNEISNCPTGIYVYDERYVPPISGNKINNCDVGIHVSGLSYDLENNEITNCGVGVVAGETGGANLIGNKIMYCSDCGLKVVGFLEAKGAYNNYFNNTVNVKFGDFENTYVWNATLVAGTNIIGGSYIGGNYWAKPDGTGFSQTAIDANGDGIADSAYAISEKNYDYLPLTAKYNMIKPDANFTANVTSGTSPLVVLFTDTSTGGTPTSWLWDTGDNITSKHAMNATHTFTNAGIYTVSLTVENNAGSDIETKPNYIIVTDPVTPVTPDPEKVLPVANFNMNVTSGYAPFYVLFTDLSENATSIKWDFNSDGMIDSESRNTVFIYNSPGTYTAKQIAINANGTTSKTATITVNTKDDDKKSSGKSHSSGGNGGAGGSPEPAKNVQVKELSQVFITNGKSIQFDFKRNTTCVVYVNFDAKKTVGKTTTIVEQLKDKSTLVSNLSEGEVYKYFNVWVGNSGFATSSNIENPAICFKVEKSWLQDENIDQDSITLNSYSNKTWEEIPVSLLKDDSRYLYFTADVSGYSFFAITGKSNTSDEDVTDIEPDGAENSENMENEGSEINTEPEEKEKTGMPGFGIVYGVAGLLVVFLYKRR